MSYVNLSKRKSSRKLYKKLLRSCIMVSQGGGGPKTTDPVCLSTIYIRTFQARKAPLRCLKFFSEFFKEHPRHIPKTALFEPFWYSDNFRRSRFYLLLKKKRNCLFNHGIQNFFYFFFGICRFRLEI